MNQKSPGLKLPTSPFILWGMVGCFYLLAFLISPDIPLFKPILSWNSMLALLPVLGSWLSWCLIANQQKFKSAENISELITTGPYAIVRHPIYLADLLGLLYLILLYPKLWIAVGGILAASAVLWWAKKEESVLKRRFGAAYEEYIKRTPDLNLLTSLFRKLARTQE